MKIKQLFLCPAAFLICCGWWSCTKTDTATLEVQEPESVEVQLTDEEVMALDCHFNGTAISKEEIMEEASDIAALLDDGVESGSRRVLSLTPVTGISSTSKSGVEDTLAFVASFGEGLGYAVLSADRRADRVLFICPDGDFIADDDSEATTKASSSASNTSFTEEITHAVLSQTHKVEDRQDSLLPLALAKIGQDMDCSLTLTKAANNYSQPSIKYIYGTWKEVERVDPLVKVNWGQDDPYNRKFPIIDGVRRPTGCCATAIAQMASCRKLYSNYFNWSLLTATPTINKSDTKACEQVSYLMKYIADLVKCDCVLNYNSGYYVLVSDHMTSDINNITSFMNTYWHQGEFLDYSFDNIFRDICHSRWPVLAYIWGLTKKECGYAWTWVIDGLFKEERTVQVIITARGVIPTKARQSEVTEVRYSYTETRSFIHCNWGKDGIENGWISAGSFDYDYDRHPVKCFYISGN